MKLFAGIDCGSVSINAVVIDGTGKILHDIEGDYQKEIRSIMDVLGTEEIEQLVNMLEKIRANLKKRNSAGSSRNDAP